MLAMLPSKATDSVDHAAQASAALPLGSHVDKGVNLGHHVSAGDIPPVLAPLAREGATARRVLRQGRRRVPDQRKPLRLVQPGSPPAAAREGLAEEGGVDDADDGASFYGEGDGHAEHGEEVGEVDGAVERVDDPGRRGIDEVVAR